MIELHKEQMNSICDFYKDCSDSTVWSCLQGYMGRAWVDQYPNPSVSRIVQGDFCFPAGNVNSPEADCILEDFPTEINKRELIVIPITQEWDDKLILSEKYKQVKRYAMKKEGFIFSEDKLMAYVNLLPAEYSLCKIDEKLYDLSLSEGWSRDFCSNFKSVEEFMEYGLGFVIMHQNKIVCGASSYTVYRDGIEIEIGTRAEYRRQGLATICGARLLLECMKRKKYPCWDAANNYSVKIAEKLGYHYHKEYSAYIINNIE